MFDFKFFVFNAIIILLFAMDIYFYNKNKINFKTSIIVSAFWIVAAILFCIYIFFNVSFNGAYEFLSIYIIEKTLSIDNLIVFAMIFTKLDIPDILQKKVLNFGIISAIILRYIMIFLGIDIVNRFPIVLKIFGLILIVAGINFFKKNINAQQKESAILKFFINNFKAVNIDSNNFFVKIDNNFKVTKLFIALILIEITDVIFAIDSIPAALAISNDFFIISSANIFALFGLRSLYTVLNVVIKRFNNIYYFLALTLIFIGAKLLLNVHLKPIFSLIVIFSLFLTCHVYNKFISKYKL